MTTFTEKVEELLTEFRKTCFLVESMKDTDREKSLNLMAMQIVITKDKLAAAHQAEISRVLERVNKEVIGDDEEVPINDVGGRVPARVLRNDLRETQRQAINKIKGEYNG